jgi:hypothetical protein
MATISKSWGDQTQIIGTGDGWVTLSGTTESLSSGVDLVTLGYEGAHVVVEVDADAGPTDDVDVKIYGSLDGTDYDDTALNSQTIDTATDPNQISFVVKDLAHFRIGATQTGATDSHNVRAYYRAWRYTSA